MIDRTIGQEIFITSLVSEVSMAVVPRDIAERRPELREKSRVWASSLTVTSWSKRLF
jgi:hypothetical protein